MNIQKLIPVLVISFIIIIISNHNTLLYAHIDNTKVQELISKNKNIKVQFGYLPEKPIIDTFTELQFSLQDLKTGEHIKDFDARVVVTNGQRLFKFENITVHDGDFSVKYIFPDDGTHQVLLRVNTNSSAMVSSFDVFVPHQAPPTLLNPFPKTVEGQYSNEQVMSIILAVLLPIAAIVSIIFVIKKNKKY